MRKISLGLLVVLIIIVNISFVVACSCAPLSSPEESLERSTAVFAGKVINIDILEETQINNIAFEVSEYWKGPSDKNLLIKQLFIVLLEDILL